LAVFDLSKTTTGFFEDKFLQMRVLERAVGKEASRDGQISLADPDRRSMATSGVVRATFATICRSRSTP
jgi:hypothetical protein